MSTATPAQASCSHKCPTYLVLIIVDGSSTLTPAELTVKLTESTGSIQQQLTTNNQQDQRMKQEGNIEFRIFKRTTIELKHDEASQNDRDDEKIANLWPKPLQLLARKTKRFNATALTRTFSLPTSTFLNVIRTEASHTKNCSTGLLTYTPSRTKTGPTVPQQCPPPPPPWAPPPASRRKHASHVALASIPRV